ncbi:hypothetical protein NQ317_014316 [Molorchus minor]|uniref:Uncharacterized protein n=1 Tax=Molorchus minor TaxID=1323400 RepID=A0ABQ9JZH5_9CUCU|nr:hypothetical protein NQ317_014316 [Molorchus minor]
MLVNNKGCIENVFHEDAFSRNVVHTKLYLLYFFCCFGPPSTTTTQQSGYKTTHPVMNSCLAFVSTLNFFEANSWEVPNPVNSDGYS